jgi:AMP nucleosidase
MTALAALDRLETLYEQSVSNLREAVGAFLRTGERADPEARAKGAFSYPQLKVSWFGERPANLETRAFARM